MTIDNFKKRVAETINDTKPARVAGDEKCIITACPMSRIKYEPYCPAHARKAMSG